MREGSIALIGGQEQLRESDIFDGIERGGFVTANSPPDDKIRVQSIGYKWINGVRVFCDAVNNIATPGAHATKWRYDLVQHNMDEQVVIKQGMADDLTDTTPLPPVPDNGYTFSRYIVRRPNANTIARNDDGVNSFLNGFHYFDCRDTIRTSAITPDVVVSSTTYVALPEMFAAFYLIYDAQVEFQFIASSITMNNANAIITIALYLDGIELSDDIVESGRANAGQKTNLYIFVTPNIMSAGAHKIVVKGKMDTGSATFNGLQRKLLTKVLGRN